MQPIFSKARLDASTWPSHSRHGEGCTLTRYNRTPLSGPKCPLLHPSSQAAHLCQRSKEGRTTIVLVGAMPLHVHRTVLCAQQCCVHTPTTPHPSPDQPSHMWLLHKCHCLSDRLPDTKPAGIGKSDNQPVQACSTIRFVMPMTAADWQCCFQRTQRAYHAGLCLSLSAAVNQHLLPVKVHWSRLNTRPTHDDLSLSHHTATTKHSITRPSQ